MVEKLNRTVSIDWRDIRWMIFSPLTSVRCWRLWQSNAVHMEAASRRDFLWYTVYLLYKNPMHFFQYRSNSCRIYRNWNIYWTQVLQTEQSFTTEKFSLFPRNIIFIHDDKLNLCSIMTCLYCSLNCNLWVFIFIIATFNVNEEHV